MTYVQTDAAVAIGLTERQVSVLRYVLARAQEDPTFFDSIVGEADAGARTVFKLTLAQIRKAVDKPLHRLVPRVKQAG